MVCIIDNRCAHKSRRISHILFHAVRAKTLTAQNTSFVYIQNEKISNRRLIAYIKKRGISRVVLVRRDDEALWEDLSEANIEVIDDSLLQSTKACLAAESYLKDRIQKGLQTVVTIFDNDFNMATQKIISAVAPFTPYIAIVTENKSRFHYLSMNLYTTTGIAILYLKKTAYTKADLSIYIECSPPPSASGPAIVIQKNSVRFLKMEPAFRYKEHLVECANGLQIECDCVALAMDTNVELCFSR